MSALMLFLECGPARFALPASAVLEVVPAVPLHPPGGDAPASLAGLLRYRGAVVPVLALGPTRGGRLGGRVVVLQSAAGARLGLLADRVGDLKPLDPTGTPYADAGSLGPLVAQPDGVVRVLDPARLFALVAPTAGGVPA